MKLEERTVRYLTPVLAWLDQGAPHTDVGSREDVGFNMNYFLTGSKPDVKGSDCGTVCCIAGAVALFNSELSHLRGEYYDEVGYQIGLTDEQTRHLFMAIPPGIGIEEMPDEWLNGITPEQAATTLRGFIETGVIDWDVKTPEVVA